MNSRSEQFAKFVLLLWHLKHIVGKMQRDIIEKCDNDLSCLMSECGHNVLKGIIPLTLAQMANLHQHKHNL